MCEINRDIYLFIYIIDTFVSMTWNLEVLFYVKSLVDWVLQVGLGYMTCVYVCPFFLGSKDLNNLFIFYGVEMYFVYVHNELVMMFCIVTPRKFINKINEN